MVLSDNYCFRRNVFNQVKAVSNGHLVNLHRCGSKYFASDNYNIRVKRIIIFSKVFATFEFVSYLSR